MNNKNLFLILIALLAIYGITRLTSGRQTGSFDTNLITLDTTQITSLVIKPKGADPEITLTRAGKTWLAGNGVISTQAVPSAVQAILGNLAEIKTTRIAAKNPEKWKDYEVEEGNGIQVKVYQEKKLLEDFIIGRFSFNQQTRAGTSFIRINGEDEVYAVDGFLTMTFGQGFDSFRDRTLFKLPAQAEITQLEFKFPDTTHQLIKNGEHWQLDGQAVDSVTVANYLNTLHNITGGAFADDFDEMKADDHLYQTITITANNQLQPQTITCYLDTTRTPPFIIRSTQNKDAFFASDTTGVFQRVFKDISSFLVKE